MDTFAMVVGYIVLGLMALGFCIGLVVDGLDLILDNKCWEGFCKWMRSW